MNNTRGVPLLSGSPPDYQGPEPSCRRCDKEFNFLLQRKQRCNHCGYSYCSTCSNYQALMPRGSGYDPVAVCAFCIEYLTITAAGRNYLKSLPLAKLKKYLDAYNIKADRVVEKDDLVDILTSARKPNGCLSPTHEDYYRKHSVPNRSTARSRGLFGRNTGAPPQSGPHPQQWNERYFPRPDVDPQWQPPPPHPAPRPRPTPTHNSPRPQPAHGSRPYSQYRPPQPPPPTAPRPQQPPVPSRPAQPSNLNVPAPNSQTRPRATSAGPSSAPPPPNLDRLLEMSPEDIGSLPISMLKSILFQNHVNARLIIEKTDLVERVKTLVDEERSHRQREAMYREIEQEEERARQFEQLERERQDRDSELPPTPTFPEPEIDLGDAISTPDEGVTEEIGKADGSDKLPPVTPPKPQRSEAKMASYLERTGLCVICQDEEANIAIVDCGHMAMCRNCSDLIMSSTRECPLCRTRIVTEARLLRIFKA